MKKKFGYIALALTLSLGLTACGGNGTANQGNNQGKNAAAQNEAAATENEAINNSANSATEETQKDEGTEAAATGEPTKENPIVVDKENKTVKVYAEVNEKYKEEPTMHLVVSESGKEGDHAMFKSPAKPLDFHDALESLGLEPGNNVNSDTAGKVQVEGDALDVRFTFDGDAKEYGVDEVVDDSSKAPIDIRFGGNYDAQKEMNTGCISCLMSCPAGITSNHAHKLGDDKKENITFMLNKENVPADKTPVVITFLAK